jgi:hypothetical protein
LSYHNRYWILNRQWIASAALMPVAVVWYVAMFARIFDSWFRWSSLGLATFCLTPLAYSLSSIVPPKLAEIRTDIATAPATLEPSLPERGDNNQWVRLANANIAEGGPVWAIFRKFYDR